MSMIDKNRPDLAQLILRVMVGLSGVFHGSQKLFWAFGGSGPRSYGTELASQGVPLPIVSAYLIGLSEVACGLLVGIGLFTRVATVPYALAMALTVWALWGRFDYQRGGFEYPLMVLAMLTAVFLAGPGRYSADHIFRSKGGGAA